MAKKGNTPKKETKVWINDSFYFIMDNYCSTLYQVKEGIKTDAIHGHYTDDTTMIKKVAKVMIADKGEEMMMASYLEELKSIQNELLNKLK